MTDQTDAARNWLVVQTKANHELVAQYHLRRQGFRVWLWHRIASELGGPAGSRRTRRVLRPYFAQYLFLRETARVDRVNDTAGVSTVLHDPGEGGPLRVGHAELSGLAESLGVEEDGFVPDREPPAPQSLEVGTRFLFADDTPFHRLLGIVAKAAELDGRKKIWAYVQMLGGESLVEVPADQVGEIVE